MLEEVQYCKGIVKERFNKPLKMSENDELCFKLMDKCHICNKKYTDNIRIHIIFHNLRSYDSHFIMQQIGQIAKNRAYTNKNGEEQHLKINAIPNNMEKYVAFTLGNHLNFIDSFQFMSLS